MNEENIGIKTNKLWRKMLRKKSKKEKNMKIEERKELKKWNQKDWVANEKYCERKGELKENLIDVVKEDMGKMR